MAPPPREASLGQRRGLLCLRDGHNCRTTVAPHAEGEDSATKRAGAKGRCCPLAIVVDRGGEGADEEGEVGEGAGDEREAAIRGSWR